MFRDKIILINDLYFADIQLIQVKDLKNDNKWLSSGALSFIWYVSRYLKWQLLDNTNTT